MEIFPKLEYLLVDKNAIYGKNWYSYWGEVTQIAPCSRCSRQMAAVDQMHDLDGSALPDEAFLFEEDRRILCDLCIEDDNDAELLALLEERIGLSEKNKRTLQEIVGIAENKDRILMVVHLHDRVNELERRLEDRVKVVSSEIESRLGGAETKLHNSSMFGNAYLAVGSFLAGIVVTLLIILITGSG